MIRPLEREFGWSRAQISIGPLMPSLAAVVMAPLVGLAVDRFRPRRIALFGVPFFSLALALLSTANDLVSWWGLYALLGVAAMFIFPMVWTAAISARFERNRGLALAIALSGTGISAAVMPVIATWLVNALGWRGAYVGIGLAAPARRRSLEHAAEHAAENSGQPATGAQDAAARGLSGTLLSVSCGSAAWQ
jgi:MFS family permease